MIGEVRVIPVALADEIRPGDSLAAKLFTALRRQKLKLKQGDILVVKHKIVSKAEGRLVVLNQVKPSSRAKKFASRNTLDPQVIEIALRESRKVLREKHVLITETRHGFICANSGVDVSNVDGGKHALLLPEDSDASALRLYKEIKKQSGVAVPVIISDSFGRAWREGLTETAIGIAGMKPLHNYRGKRDAHGYTLHATEDAVADELACAAGLVCGKLNRVPFCVVRGFRYQPGRGRAAELIRPAAKDLFR